MFCSKCGKEILDNSSFCNGCGNPTGASSEAKANENLAGNGANVNAGGYAPVNNPPALKLKTNRGLLKYILLSLITFGIYSLVVMSSISTDINEVASRHDGRKTMHFCLVAFIFSWLTCGIVPLVWYHNISDRIGCELRRRGIPYSFGAGSYWGWAILGSLICVGPFIYMHKLFKSMNLLCADYNVRG